jgi:hypothetical protein
MIDRPTGNTPAFGRRAALIAATPQTGVVQRAANDIVNQMEWPAQRSTERPVDLIWFDRSQMLAFAISFAQIFLTLPVLRDLMEQDPVFGKMGMSFFDMFALLVSGCLFSMGLWFCASRLRSNIARWVLTLVYVSAVWTNVQQLMAPPTLPIPMPVSIRLLAGLSTLIGSLGVALLHTPAARDWFAKR